MKRTAAVVSFLLLTTAACRAHDAHPGRSRGIENFPSARDLHQLAETYRTRHKLPALGIGVVHEGRIVGLGMAGERAAGSGDWASLEDAFDVASCSKSVTATVAAMLVEGGKVRWDTTLAETFPELRGLIHPGYAEATLELLLRHRAGLNHEMNTKARWAGWHRQHAFQTPIAQRLRFATAALQRPPRSVPGTATFYSSDGYLVAASMLERVAGLDWETVVRTRLFEPLGLRSMRFGMSSADGSTTRVLGHESAWFGRSRVVTPDTAEYGIHPFGAPAGFLYASVPDLLRYVDFHIQGWNGNGRLLERGSFQRLHARTGDEPYALGWESEVKRDEGGRIYEHSVHHGGYSGRFRANIWFTPETQWGTVIVTNHGRGDDSASADIFYALLGEFRSLPAGASH
jgi:CubicO group peptidase (beta-lactamase class C family)